MAGFTEAAPLPHGDIGIRRPLVPAEQVKYAKTKQPAETAAEGHGTDFNGKYAKRIVTPEGKPTQGQKTQTPKPKPVVKPLQALVGKTVVK